MSDLDDIFTRMKDNAAEKLGTEKFEEISETSDFIVNIFHDEIKLSVAEIMKTISLVAMMEPNKVTEHIQIALVGSFMFGIAQYREWLQNNHHDLDLLKLEGRK